MDPSQELSGKLVNLQGLVGKRGLEASRRENELTERQIAIVEIVTVFTHTFQLTSQTRSLFEVCGSGVLVKPYCKPVGVQGLVCSSSGLTSHARMALVLGTNPNPNCLCHFELGLC